MPGAEIEASIEGGHLVLHCPAGDTGCTAEREVADHVFVALEQPQE